MEITRSKYLNDLKNRMNNGMIKVITGMRRAGKTYLLFTQFYRFLKETGIKPDAIVRLSLDDDINEEYRDASKLSLHLRSLIKDDDVTYYLLLDEIQFAISEEELLAPTRPMKVFSMLNGLLRLPNVDIYVTGSNSRFLSSDVLTEFRGRGDEVHILPLTFSEFMNGYDGDVYNGWAEYSLYGGLPSLLSMPTDEQKASYLSNLFKNTYRKDIISRNNIRKTQELDDLVRILASSVGSLTNPTRIVNTFNTVLHATISVNTILNYLDYLKDSFILSEANRYDVKGRKNIGSPNKYYFEDIGIRNSILNYRQDEENHIMENVIYNELRYRGFAVDVGIVEKRMIDNTGSNKRINYEIDFIATQGSKKFYLQSALALSDCEKEKQEKNSLLNIPDSFKKIIIVKDVVKTSRDDDGIVTIGLFEFLQNQNSLDL